MTPESEFKKFLIVILLLIASFVLISSSNASKYVKKFQSSLVSKIFLEDKEITSEISESEQVSEDWFTKNFKKKNPYEYWISGNVKINSLSNYNNVSKEQIYTFRKYYVNKTIFKNKDYVPNEQDFLDRLDEMVEQAFDDQCTGANPRLSLMSEIKEMYLKAYYGE